MAPRIVGSYEILSIVGRGGIGTVYRARHAGTGRPAAVKLLGPTPAIDPLAVRRLAREFEALQGLLHPNIVRVFDAGVVDGYSFLVMELIEGLDLRTYLSPELDLSLPISPASVVPCEPSPDIFDLERLALEPNTESFSLLDRSSHGAQEMRTFADTADEPDTDPHARSPASNEPAPSGDQRPSHTPPPVAPRLLKALNAGHRVQRLVNVLHQVCQALAFIHERGYVHRDLKPSNIMVDDRHHTYLMDFGLVKSIEDAGLNRTGRVVGTYLYMSPEQARGLAVDGRSDLYSLGVILYELLCGRPPRRVHRPGKRWLEVLSEPPPPVRTVNPEVDVKLAGIAERLLRPDPSERFQSAEEVLEVLERGT